MSIVPTVDAARTRAAETIVMRGAAEIQTCFDVCVELLREAERRAKRPGERASYRDDVERMRELRNAWPAIVKALVFDVNALLRERLSLAMLSAPQPQFPTPLHTWAAQIIRDDVLADVGIMDDPYDVLAPIIQERLNGNG